MKIFLKIIHFMVVWPKFFCQSIHTSVHLLAQKLSQNTQGPDIFVVNISRQNLVSMATFFFIWMEVRYNVACYTYTKAFLPQIIRMTFTSFQGHMSLTIRQIWNFRKVEASCHWYICVHMSIMKRLIWPLHRFSMKVWIHYFTEIGVWF